MSDFSDLSARFRQARGQDEKPAERPFDHAESMRLRGKMLGVLLRDAREKAARTLEDCARLLRISPQEVEAWEYGEQVPSLPQIELLAYYLDVPVSHFWGQQTLTKERQVPADAQTEYLHLRDRMVGALLRQAREARGLSIEELASASSVPAERVQQYELGALSIPMHELSVFSNAVQQNMGYFLEAGGQIGELLKIREEWQKFTDLDEEIRAFAANPLNVGFIKIAIMFSRMPADQLRKIAEGMLDITM